MYSHGQIHTIEWWRWRPWIFSHRFRLRWSIFSLYCCIDPHCMSGGYVWIWVFNTYIHSVFLVAMFRFESYRHGSTVYVWWPWLILLDMDLHMSAFMLWVICIMSMGMPTSVIIYYCTVFPCLLVGFWLIVPCSLHTLDKIFQLSLCSNFILWGALCYTLFSSSYDH